MQILLLFSVLLSVAIGTVVGIRLLLLAKRTRRFPEFAVGSALFGYAAVAQTALMITRAIGSEISFGLHMALAILCVLGYYAMLLGLSAFTYQVFGADSTWRRWLMFLVVATGLVGAYLVVAAEWHRFGQSGQMPVSGRVGMTPQYVLVLGWMSIESLRYWRLMRRRLALGLADAEVTARFAVWGASAGIGSVLLVALLAVSLTRVGTFQEDPLTLVLVCSAGIVNTAGWWLTFMPPRRYSEWLRGAATTNGESVG